MCCKVVSELGVHFDNPAVLVPGLARVAERGRPDRHCSDGNRENAGLPAARIHPHEWATCVSTGAPQAVFREGIYHSFISG